MSTIRKATQEDLNRIEERYNEVLTAEEEGLVTTGWIRGVYPTRRVAETALSKDTLYVLEDEGKIVATAKIDREQVAEYALAHWSEDTPPEKVLVLHTLIVSPSVKKKGYGTHFVAFYESLARKAGCTALRVDTNERNLAARSLYRKLGFSEVAALPCDFNGIPDVVMICLEKLLPPIVKN